MIWPIRLLQLATSDSELKMHVSTQYTKSKIILFYLWHPARVNQFSEIISLPPHMWSQICQQQLKIPTDILKYLRKLQLRHQTRKSSLLLFSPENEMNQRFLCFSFRNIRTAEVASCWLHFSFTARCVWKRLKFANQSTNTRQKLSRTFTLITAEHRSLAVVRFKYVAWR